MPAKLEEIEGTFRAERYRSGEFMIGEIELIKTNGAHPEFMTIKGEADQDELARNGRYRFYGKFVNYFSKWKKADERQFQFQTFVPAISHDRDGVVEYLLHTGKGLGFGRATATKLFDAYGSDAVKVARESPEKILDHNRSITREQCIKIGERLELQKATEDATIELASLLSGRGLPKTTPRKAIRKWGNRAAQVVSKDPYTLMAFRGCGFKRCDALWIEFGHRSDRLKRQALCAWYSVASNAEGHTWFPVEHVVQSIRENIGSAKCRPKAAIKLALRLAKLSPNHYGALAMLRSDGADGPVIDEGGCVWIAEGNKATAERHLARMVASAIREKRHHWPAADNISGIDSHQKEKLSEALTSTVAILGGSPGTGKTYATAMLIRHLLQSGNVGPIDIAIGAPTGKAAVRITEAMQVAGVPLQAKTWHSLLGVSQSDDDQGGWSFIHNHGNPWPYRIIIGDESSMLDTTLMRSVFAARPRGCHVLLVGDVNQLPPVGNGAPLRDLINSQCVGYGELTEIKRNSGGIVEACAAIRDGQPWREAENLIVDHYHDQIKAAIVHCQSQGKSIDPVWDCQVLVAVNDRSSLSRKAVNRELQSVLNPNPEIKGTPFRIADKIVCLKNGKYIEVDSDGAEVYVANGELAKVLEVDTGVIIAELSNPSRTIRIPRGKSSDSEDGDKDSSNTGCSWDLAYGLSTHKSQGSEWPVVIVLIDEYPGARMVCSREWIYTAISRAKQKCILVGKKSTADAMCYRVAIGNRKTFLRELVQLNVAQDAMEAM